MDTYPMKRLLDDVETHLRRAKRKCHSGSEPERHIKRALFARTSKATAPMTGGVMRGGLHRSASVQMPDADQHQRQTRQGE